LIYAPLYEEAPAAFEAPDANPIDNPEINKEPEEADLIDAFGQELDQ
jgi:hypothetical protein